MYANGSYTVFDKSTSALAELFMFVFISHPYIPDAQR